MTETARTRLLATALDTADSAATVVVGAAAGLAAYRALADRPIETRLTLSTCFRGCAKRSAGPGIEQDPRIRYRWRAGSAS